MSVISFFVKVRVSKKDTKKGLEKHLYWYSLANTDLKQGAKSPNPMFKT